MPSWTAELVLAEARWAALSPASDGFNTADPAGLVGDDVDPVEPRAALLDWFAAAASEAARQGALRSAELESWHSRFSRDRSMRAWSTATTRRHLPRVATAIARILTVGGSTWAAPPTPATTHTLTVAGMRQRNAGQTAAQRQRAYRARRRARLESVPSMDTVRQALLRVRPRDTVVVAEARRRASRALVDGAGIDAARALDELYTATNDQDDPGAVVAARWAAELYPAGSVEAYFLHNSAWGVVIRHRELAVGRQPVWAALAAETAFAALSEDVRREDAYVRVRRTERFAHAVFHQARTGRTAAPAAMGAGDARRRNAESTDY